MAFASLLYVARGTWSSVLMDLPRVEGELAGLLHWRSPILWDLFLGLARFFHKGMFRLAWRLGFWELSGGRAAGSQPPHTPLLVQIPDFQLDWCPPSPETTCVTLSTNHPWSPRVGEERGRLSTPRQGTGSGCASCLLPGLSCERFHIYREGTRTVQETIIRP